MLHKYFYTRIKAFAVFMGFIIAGFSTQITADEPTVLHPNLEVRTLVNGLITPISFAFISPNDILVLEKNTGQVKRIVDGSLHSTVLDLAVNFASERGLLGITLDPDFPNTPFVYLYWTESTSGDDSNVLSQTLLLGNRVDRFIWDGSTLTLDQNLIRIRAIQDDDGQQERGNHDGGVLRFGPDEKLYIFIGDVGRRGHLQNLPCGPTEICPGVDDQFGGPEPDNAHLTGVILRLNSDGSTPEDNPFFDFGAAMGGEVGENLQKIFSYGHRNAFGMAFDPKSGDLWLAENGDDTFTEISRILPGTNGGWVQIMGPVERINQYKQIETSFDTDPITGGTYFGLQQIRWSPENIADTQEEALSRLFVLPGSQYRDPEFSWKFEVSPAGIGFINGQGLGPQFNGDMIIGAARTFLEGGHLFHFNLTGNRRKIAVDDPRLNDRVADNLHKWDITESESLLFGRNFGISTDIQTGPNGNLYIVSLSNGAIYEVFRTSQSSSNKLALSSNDTQPLEFKLLQNHPNPFNPTTKIVFQVADYGYVALKVYDVMGKEIVTLIDEEKIPGVYEVEFSTKGGPDTGGDVLNLSSGIYFYRLTAGSFISTKKMLMIK